MGQKVNPYSFRLGYIKDWKSQWYAEGEDFAEYLHEDIKIRRHIKETIPYGAISKIVIERAGEKLKLTVYTARPGVVIGRRGSNIEALKDELEDMIQKQIFIDIEEVENPAVEAQLIAENISFQLEKRVNFRRAMKKSMQVAKEGGVEGVKIDCTGRLGGAEMSRKESYKDGNVPLQTVRADIDYGFSEANTTAGSIGVKVWVYHGDILFPYLNKEERKKKEKEERQKKEETKKE